MLNGWLLLPSLLWKGDIGGSERLSNLSKSTQLGGGLATDLSDFTPVVSASCQPPSVWVLVPGGGGFSVMGKGPQVREPRVHGLWHQMPVLPCTHDPGQVFSLLRAPGSSLARLWCGVSEPCLAQSRQGTCWLNSIKLLHGSGNFWGEPGPVCVWGGSLGTQPRASHMVGQCSSRATPSLQVPSGTLSPVR